MAILQIDEITPAHEAGKLNSPVICGRDHPLTAILSQPRMRSVLAEASMLHTYSLSQLTSKMHHNELDTHAGTL
jgi:hypothetical protein